MSSKRVLAIHDLSGFGNTSLQAAITILSRMGFRVCALPTIILSANTMYQDPRTMDFSPYLMSFVEHWKELKLKFDAIYSGFLAGPDQLALIEETIDRLKGKKTMVLVDPVMADQGQLYGCYDERMVDAMRKLIRKAHLITPNYTEAALLLGKPYDPLGEGVDLKAWCQELSRMGPKEVVITSAPCGTPLMLKTVCLSEEGFGAMMFIQKEGLFPGAGDAYASFLLAGVLSGYETRVASDSAVRMVSAAIHKFNRKRDDWREGIPLEQMMDWDFSQFAPSANLPKK